MTRRGLGAGLLTGLAAPAIAQSQSASAWPDRPVRLIVPFGAGGAIDTLSRTVAQRFSEFANGQSLVVENRSGAGGTVAGGFVAREKPDGYTLMMADVGSNAIGKLLNPGLAYDPATAFTPIIHLVNLPGVVIAHPSVTVKDLPDLIAQAKARPGAFTYSSAGIGNGSHLFMALLLRQAGVEMVHVPYRSGAEMVTALVRGDAQFGFPTVSSALQMIRGGQAKAIAVSTAEETPALPGIPPVARTIPGFNLAVWHGIMAPAEMEPALASRINTVFARVAALPEVQEAVFRAQAGRMVGGSPKDFADHIAREIARWEPLIREGGFKVE
ncbi:tripartite tricarboxylate transporter substrate binding protein [Roseomonas sp. SSH11]|uniref:Tripartite tricarboxylate transporter substrate binding protein n=2 Tax=Pararoseomonas baculiformis TaxID=2820812 RepID=A0ABS4AHU0_9PROT|nr:tripartite tricarboxylate transporter substrate binding protein [Pararoseomonas baculiformis]